MNDASLEAECFGGAYKAKVYDHCKLILKLTFDKHLKIHTDMNVSQTKLLSHLNFVQKYIPKAFWSYNLLLDSFVIGCFKTLVVCPIAASSYPEERLRYWNGYLLFYEKMEEVRTPMSAKKSRVSSKVLKSAEKTE